MSANTPTAGWFPVDNDFVDSGRMTRISSVGGALGVWIAMCRFAHNNPGCYASAATLAEKALITRRQAFKAIAHLGQLGELEIVKPDPGEELLTILYRVARTDDERSRNAAEWLKRCDRNKAMLSERQAAAKRRRNAGNGVPVDTMMVSGNAGNGVPVDTMMVSGNAGNGVPVDTMMVSGNAGNGVPVDTMMVSGNAGNGVPVDTMMVSGNAGNGVPVDTMMVSGNAGNGVPVDTQKRTIKTTYKKNLEKERDDARASSQFVNSEKALVDSELPESEARSLKIAELDPSPARKTIAPPSARSSPPLPNVLRSRRMMIPTRQKCTPFEIYKEYPVLPVAADAKQIAIDSVGNALKRLEARGPDSPYGGDWSVWLIACVRKAAAGYRQLVSTKPNKRHQPLPAAQWFDEDRFITDSMPSSTPPQGECLEA